MSGMIYNRIWFNKNKFAWTVGGGLMNNPGRYLVLYPTGQASPLPNPTNPTQTEGAFPFSANPGDKFRGWDCSTNLDFMPNQSLTFRVEYVHREANVPYFCRQRWCYFPYRIFNNNFTCRLEGPTWLKLKTELFLLCCSGYKSEFG